MSARIVIVGAGISGLATAWHLEQILGPTVSIRVLEKGQHVGGTAWTETRDGYLLERGPNGFLDNRESTLRLCHALGLTSELRRANPSSADRFIFLGDRLRKLPSSLMSFIFSDLLSMKGKLRVASERLMQPWMGNQDETIYDFGCRRIGREATEVLLDAFVTGILAGDSQLLSLPACFPRMREMEQKYGGLFRAMNALARERREAARSTKQKDDSTPIGSPRGHLTTIAGGMGRLTTRIADQLRSRPILNAPVDRIERVGGQWRIQLAEGTEEADVVVFTSPGQSQARLTASLDGELSDLIAGIPYSSATVAVLGYPTKSLPHLLKGFGYLAPARLGRPVLGVIFSSSIFPDQAPPEHVQFRAILGGWKRPDVVQWSDDQVVSAVQDDLSTTLGVTVEPTFRWVHRWPRAIPQYHIGHLDRLKRIDERRTCHPGLFLGGNAYRGVALNDCIADGERIAQDVRDYLERSDLLGS